MADEQGTTIVIKKIKKGGHGHHGGAWKVAYADFVTAMMAFFLVMWIVGMSQPQKEGIQKYFNDPMKYLMGSDKIFSGIFSASAGRQIMDNSKSGGVTDSSRPGGLDRTHLIAKQVESTMDIFKDEIFDFKVHPDRIQFAITAEALFSPGATLLRPEAEKILNNIAGILKSVDASFIVEAHTDDLPTDSPLYSTNWELSALRAATVVRYFIEGHFFDPSKITASGAAQYRPIADNRTPAGRAKNRRVDIFIIPDKSNRLGFTEGKPEATTGNGASVDKAPASTPAPAHGAESHH